MTSFVDPDHYEAGIRSRRDPDGAKPDRKQQKMVRLSEVKQLIIPVATELPEALAKLRVDCTDLVQLGHELFLAHTEEKPVLILGLSEAVAQAAFQYPSLLNLQAAVITDIPGADYSPLFNQAVYGLNALSWSYLLDAMGLDDKFSFDVNADPDDDSDREDPDVVPGYAGAS